jgi:hypothetical protein
MDQKLPLQRSVYEANFDKIEPIFELLKLHNFSVMLLTEKELIGSPTLSDLQAISVHTTSSTIPPSKIY